MGSLCERGFPAKNFHLPAVAIFNLQGTNNTPSPLPLRTIPMAVNPLVEHHNFPASNEIRLEDTKAKRSHYFRVYSLGKYTANTTAMTQSGKQIPDSYE